MEYAIMPEDNLSPLHFEGMPCRKCGSTRRYMRYKNCVNCHHDADRKWQQENLEIKRKWQQTNPEKRRKSKRKWQQTNPEKVRESSHKSCRKWRQANAERCRERNRIWRLANSKTMRECNRAAAVKARAKRKQAVGSHTTQEWIDLNEQYGYHCLRCKKHESEFPINSRTGRPFPIEQDHIIPLSKGGTNWITNIQPLCHDCNGMGGKGINTTDFRSE
jgi:hypothetical protein